MITRLSHQQIGVNRAALVGHLLFAVGEERGRLSGNGRALFVPCPGILRAMWSLSK